MLLPSEGIVDVARLSRMSLVCLGYMTTRRPHTNSIGSYLSSI